MKELRATVLVGILAVVSVALVIFGVLAFLAPFLFQGGWGGLLMVAGILGGNIAGWVSDLFFQSRRGPVAAALYGILVLSSLGMGFTLAPGENVVGWAKDKTGLEAGDRIDAIAGHDVKSWHDIRNAVVCWEPTCDKSGWDAERCVCSTSHPKTTPAHDPQKGIPATIERGGNKISVMLPDAKAVQEAGDMRLLPARPVLPMSPYFLGAIVFLMSLCVIGTHGVLSGTATMDFGGRKGAATAVGVIDGFVYLGTSVQSVSLGYLTSKDWSYWPWFLLPFGIIGLLLCLKIWNARPGKGGGH